MGTWKEQYRQAMHGQASMLSLLRSGMAALQASGDAGLRSSIVGERFVAPYALCDALDACGIPAPSDAMPPMTVDTQHAATISKPH